MAQINKPNTYFNTKLYTGTGATQSITGVNFQPDLVWIKDRTVGFDHVLQDSVRGTTKIINSNQTYAEFTNANSITSFNSDGFTTGSYVATNNNTTPFVSWNWKAGGTAVSNTDGSITSSVSANTTSGFSIVSYTGTGSAGTVGHGLGSDCKLMIIKNRTDASNWIMYHQTTAENRYMELNTTNAEAINFDYWQSTKPTSSVFTIGTANTVNGSSDNMIAYCFAEKKGFSKFGKYTGNGSADGTFVYTGFKPAFIILKRSDSVADWFMHDNKRNGFNPDNDYLQANLNSAETNFDGLLDFVSNGFKLKTTSTAYNASGGTYIYMAFAQNPLVGSNGVPCTAR